MTPAVREKRPVQRRSSRDRIRHLPLLDGAGSKDIDTVLIGAFTNDPGRFFVQVTFEGAEWLEDRPGEED